MPGLFKGGFYFIWVKKNKQAFVGSRREKVFLVERTAQKQKKLHMKV